MLRVNSFDSHDESRGRNINCTNTKILLNKVVTTVGNTVYMFHKSGTVGSRHARRIEESRRRYIVCKIND